MLLDIRHVSKQYRTGIFREKSFLAVDDLSFQIEDGEIFGLIGGSGCGKTTIARMILGLLKPTAGEILFDGKDLGRLEPREWKTLRKEIQMVFQNPQMTFNPRDTVYAACLEPALNYGLVKTKKEKRRMAESMLEQVGLTKDQFQKYPHEISGGQAQRLAVIRALSLNPRLLVCDEPTSMLDVSVQAQILNLLQTKYREYGLAMMLISHDLEVVRHFCDRVGVMQEGRLVETGTAEEVFENPKKEYTKTLIRSCLSF